MPTRFTATVATLLIGIFSSAVSLGSEVQRERWTLSTQAGITTLALMADAGAPPVIMFVCRVRFPGTAQVIIPWLDPDLANRRLQIDLASGAASVMTPGERSAGPVSEQVAVLGEISVEQLTAILRSPSPILTWRVDAANSFQKPNNTAPMPHAFSRHRTEFLRFCA